MMGLKFPLVVDWCVLAAYIRCKDGGKILVEFLFMQFEITLSSAYCSIMRVSCTSPEQSTWRLSWLTSLGPFSGVESLFYDFHSDQRDDLDTRLSGSCQL